MTRLFLSPVTIDQLSPDCLFLAAVHRTRSPLSECDYNIHKSNSTYFSDMDISRGNLSLLLFSQRLSYRSTDNTALMILSGVQCVFRKEIKPYEPYEVWSRILSWDEKWIYIVTHFVPRNTCRPTRFYLQGRGTPREHAPSERPGANCHVPGTKKVFASAVSRYVFKQGRKTYPPQKMLVECGLLPPNPEPLASAEPDPCRMRWKAIEERRRKDLGIAQLQLGWDAVHDCFEDVPTVLGQYTDLLWR